MMMTLIERNEKPIKRTVEIAIGLMTWLTVTIPIWASFLAPDAMAYFILIMTVYWFWKSMTYAIASIVGYYKLKSGRKTDWWQLVTQQKYCNKMRHIVILPNYKELEDKLELTIRKIAEQSFPVSQIAVVLAMEEREGAVGQDKARNLVKKYQNTFGDIFATYHPEIVGEVAGKSSNQAWAGKEAKKRLIDEKKWDLDYTTITSCDADSLLPREYFSALSYKFLTSPKPYLSFWQAHITEYSNINRVIMPVQLMCAITSVIRMGYSLQDEFFIPYTTYSSSLKLIYKSGFWDVDIIPEDWHMFFKTFFHEKGEVSTEAINLTIHGDAIEGDNFLDNLKNRYIQNRRHAWGVTDIPYFVNQFLRQPTPHFFRKLTLLLRVYEIHFLWPTSWFILTLGINLPGIINPQLKDTVLGYNFSRIAGTILGWSFIFTFIFITMDRLARPYKTKGDTLGQKILFTIYWVLIPFISLITSALPGLDAHTRLMLNKKIEYVVAPKKVD